MRNNQWIILSCKTFSHWSTKILYFFITFSIWDLCVIHHGILKGSKLNSDFLLLSRCSSYVVFFAENSVLPQNFWCFQKIHINTKILRQDWELVMCWFHIVLDMIGYFEHCLEYSFKSSLPPPRMAISTDLSLSLWTLPIPAPASYVLSLSLSCLFFISSQFVCTFIFNKNPPSFTSQLLYIMFSSSQLSTIAVKGIFR